MRLHQGRSGMIYRGNGLKPLLIYIDHNSPRPDNLESIDNCDSTKNMNPYKGVKGMYAAAVVLFIFCHRTIDPGFLQTFNDTDDCFVLREEECKSFFMSKVVLHQVL